MTAGPSQNSDKYEQDARQTMSLNTCLERMAPLWKPCGCTNFQSWYHQFFKQLTKPKNQTVQWVCQHTIWETTNHLVAIDKLISAFLKLWQHQNFNCPSIKYGIFRLSGFAFKLVYHEVNFRIFPPQNCKFIIFMWQCTDSSATYRLHQTKKL